MKTLIKKIKRKLKEARTRRSLYRFISIICCVVVFVTTYSLVLPAITMEKEAQCGIEAHEHSSMCYEKVLVCSLDETEGHTHTDACYRIERILDCSLEEHTHGPECRDAEGLLVCGKQEHTHGEGCYREEKELICGLEESEGHTHSDSCYEEELICGKEVHVHSASCYQVDETDGEDPEDEFEQSGSAFEEFEDDSSELEDSSDQDTEEFEEAGDYSGEDARFGDTDTEDEEQETTVQDNTEAVNAADAGVPVEVEEDSDWQAEEAGDNGSADSSFSEGEDTSGKEAEEEDFEAGEDFSEQDTDDEGDYSEESASEGSDLADDSPENSDTQEPDSEDYSSEDDESEDYGSEDYSSEDDESEDYGSDDFDSEELDSEDYGSEDYGSEDYGSEDFDSEELDSGESDAQGQGDSAQDSEEPGTADSDYEGQDAEGQVQSDQNQEVQDGDSQDSTGSDLSDQSENDDNELTDAASGPDEQNAADEAESGFSADGQDSNAQEEADSAGMSDEAAAYVPQLDPVDIGSSLSGRTSLWYYPAVYDENGNADTAGMSSSDVTEWKKVEKDTPVSASDFIRVYIAYKLPAGALNETNPIARYVLPQNIHLTDEQIEAMNGRENGYYLSLPQDTEDDGESKDYLGAEAVEGTRLPDEDLGEGEQEYISATVKGETIKDEEGNFLRQELVFTFLPYTIEKNQNVYALKQNAQGTDDSDTEAETSEGPGSDSGPQFTLFSDDTQDQDSFVSGDTQDQDFLVSGDTQEQDSFVSGDTQDQDSFVSGDMQDQGVLISEGLQVRGYFAVDLTTDQIDFVDASADGRKEAEIVFAEEDRELGISGISRTVTLRDPSAVRDGDIKSEDDQASDAAASESSESADGDSTKDNSAAEDGSEEASAESTSEEKEESGKEDKGKGDNGKEDSRKEDNEKEDNGGAAKGSGSDKEADAAEENREDSGRTKAGSSEKDNAAEELDREEVLKRTMPAQSFEDSIKIVTGRPASIGSTGTVAEAADALPERATVRVRVEADEGTFPAGTTMVLSAVEQDQLEAVADAVENAVSDNPENTNKKTCGFQAVDISFRDKDGKEIEPAKPIRVAMTSSMLQKAAQNDAIAEPVVVHVDDEGKGEQIDLIDPADIEPAQGRTEEAILEEAAAEAEEAASAAEAEEAAAAEAEGNAAAVEAEGDAAAVEAEGDAAAVEAEEAGKDDKEDSRHQSNGTEDDSSSQQSGAAGVSENALGPEGSGFEAAGQRAEDGGEETENADANGADRNERKSDDTNTENAKTGGTDENTESYEKDTEQAVGFEAAEFSVYAIVYTVDFHWEVDGKEYEFRLPGGGFISLSKLVELLGIGTETTRSFIEDVENAVFSSPELVWVGKAEEDITVGALKEANGLEVVYSAELTEEEIEEINAQTVAAGDWALISMQAFTSEESLTVTMKNGERFEIRVTDAHEIPDSSSDTIDVSKSYLICYEYNGQYYLLKNDGSTDNTHAPESFENLNSTYCWTFNYVFEEKDVEETLTYVYYLIRPIDNKTKTIALNTEGEGLVQRSNNNVAVVPAEGGGFKLIGYNNIRLDFDGDSGQFLATEFPDNNPDDGITVHIWEMDTLPSYSYTAYSADENRGSVQISGGTAKTEDIEDDEGEVIQTIHYYEAESGSDKMNAGAITATPVNHPDGQGHNKWIFDHWTQDNIPLDRDQYPATINANTLSIPFNGSKLVAHFKQNPAYDVPPDEKEPSSFEDLQDWIDSLSTTPVPINNEETTKTSEVYDYENRIYRVDIASKSNFKTFNGNVDMAFCMDVSNSMYFPSALVETTSANHANPMPIYQINWSDSGWWGSYDNRGWLDTRRNWNNPYYLIADQANTATVFKVYYQDGKWKAQDASRETESDRSFNIGDTFTTNWAGTGTHPFNAGDNDNTTYTIYDSAPDEQGIKRNRFYYLNQGLLSATTDLTTIKNILAVAGDNSPGVNVAYNTFNLNLGSQRQDFQPVSPITGIDLSNSHGGGTRPDQAFINAQGFDWNGDDRYLILITDGAPQGKRSDDDFDNTFDNISAYVEEQAQILKDYGGVKFITIGLSLDKVPHGKQLLYDLADDDKNGEKMFFLAEDAKDLPNILRQVVKTIMDDAIVMADVTDTVGEAFYAVDKNTGLPLVDGDMIDIEGRLTTDPEQAAGIVQIEDGITTIKWTNQAIDSKIGWHGTLFVKAREDFIGGNAMRTNGEAGIAATMYRMGDKEYTFDDSLIGDKLKSLEVDFGSPRVNVNELSIPTTDTEWTVYLGTEVDPAAQLKKLYEDILVEKVVNDDDSLHYPLSPNDITDNREKDIVGDAATFRMSDIILECLKATAGTDNDLAALYVQGDELNWNAFLAAILEPNGVTVPYHLFGTEGEDSSFKIRLTRQILNGEEDDLVNHSPHNTTVVNEGDTPVEKYVLTIRFDPDYDHVLPSGQGGHGNYNYSTGTYGAMYQGHAAGRETSNFSHTVNVYNVPLDVYKTDGNNAPLSGATFKLYKEDDENGTVVAELDSNKKYIEVAAATSGNNGIARLKHNGEDFGLVRGETYYLIESSAPVNYTKVNTVWAVEVQTEMGKFTNLDGEVIYSQATPPPDVGSGVTDELYPFNWDQGARIVLDGKHPVTVIAKGEEEGTTTTITDGSFVSHEKAISFRHTVLNLGGDISITVNKTWDDDDNPNRPSSIAVTLYRVSEKDHLWGNGRVVPSACTEEGVEEYTCTECGKRDFHVISEAGHTPGTAHRENEIPATCEMSGSYDTVVRCTVCNAIISSETTEIPKISHTWVNRQTAATDPDYCYDTVNVCSVCDAVDEESRQHHAHDWGEWEVTTPAQPGVAGEETRVCNHDSSHTETRATDPLPTEHTVTIYFRYTGNGSGGTDYPGQIRSITERSGTGNGDMTIQWDWNQWTEVKPFDVSGLNGSTYSTYSTADGRDYTRNYENGRWVERGKRQTLTIQNITENLLIYVTIRNGGWAGTDSSLIYQPTFAGSSGRSARSYDVSSRDRVSTTAQALGRKGSGQTDGILRSGEDELEPGSDSGLTMTSAELAEYLENLKSKDEATCAETEGAVRTYKEEVDTYTISSGDNDTWTLNIPDLPKYNEYGKEYTYYVVEDNPSPGYEVTYTGQDDGLHDEDSVTINNKKLFGTLVITKDVKSTEINSQGEYPDIAGTYTYAVSVTVEINGTTYYVQDTDGTLGTEAPANPLQVSNTADLTIENLPYGLYTVSEIQPGDVSVPLYSYVIEEGVSADTGSSQVSAEAGQVDLVNMYIRGAAWTPEVKKTLNGGTYSGTEYSFTLTETTSGRTYTDTASTAGDFGEAVFETIMYHNNDFTGTSGVFTYTITENRQDPIDYVQYDESTIYVMVTVTREQGRLTAVGSYYSDPSFEHELDVPVFNNMETAGLTVRKEVSGSYQAADSDTFPITIKKGDLFLNSSGELVDTDPQLTIRHDQTLSFTNIPVGMYIVTEGDAEKPGYTLVTTYSCQVGSEVLETQTVTLERGDSGSVVISNVYYQAEVSIIKIDETTRDSAQQTRLPDAKFRLFKYTIPEGSSTGNYTVFPDAASSEKTTDENGSLTFTELTDGRYRVDETLVPDGYVAQEKLEIYFTIERGEISWTDETGTVIIAQNLVTYSPADNTFTVGNTPGAALPYTGGPGTTLICLIGLIMTAIAGAGLVMRRRR